MVKGTVLLNLDISRTICAVTAALAVQACSSPNNTEWNEIGQVDQQITNSCGVTNVCDQFNACTSWDRDTVGDGLGYNISPPSSEQTGLSWGMQCECTECDGSDDFCSSDDDPCPGQASDRRSGLLAARPGMPQALVNGLMVTPSNVLTNYHESQACSGHLGQGGEGGEVSFGVCIRNWTYSCRVNISGLASQRTDARPVCGCAVYHPLACLPGSVVVAGIKHSCALLNGGAQCWGGNDVGQLGDGSTDDHKIQRVGVSGLGANVNTIAAGGSHTCAIVGGAVQCWGDNSQRQLGKVLPNGAMFSRVPVGIPNLSSVQAIAGGNAHTCAVVNGAAKCWGDNAFGELGDSSTDPRTGPVDVTTLGTGVQAVTAGGQHSCAIVNGAAKCWGYNGNGQLGVVIQGSDRSTQPVQVNGLTSGVTAIVAGLNHTCAIVNGGVKCWGNNATGQLGNGSTDPVPPGTLISVGAGLASGVTGIVAGQSHTCAIAAGGAVKCWGANNLGQIGADPNDSNPHPSPTPLPALAAGVRALYSGSDHACAVASGGLQCWGSNQNGQLAQDVDAGSQSPTPIAIGGMVCGLQDGVVQCFPATGCQDGTIEQMFGGGMVGCAGGTTHVYRGVYCAAGYQPATAADWVAKRGVAVPSHDYWVNDQLKYNGDSGACFVSTTVGWSCNSVDTPMRICTTARDMNGRDADGNSCNWINCGFNTATPSQYFGGCNGNTTAGTLCIPAP